MASQFLTSTCGTAFAHDIRSLLEFITSFEGQMTILSLTLLRKIFTKLLRSQSPEAREFAVALATVTVVLTVMAMKAFELIPMPRVYLACFPQEEERITTISKTKTAKKAARQDHRPSPSDPLEFRRAN
jgi:hypothetical protein